MYLEDFVKSWLGEEGFGRPHLALTHWWKVGSGGMALTLAIAIIVTISTSITIRVTIITSSFFL